LERGYLGLEFLAGLPGSRLSAIELRVNPLTQALNLCLKFRLAISACLRLLGFQLIKLRTGIRCGLRPLFMFEP
jgi:hypothetical protein